MTEQMFGYARVSTADQDHEAQVRALVAAGVPTANVATDKLSGILRAADRPGLSGLLPRLRAGDTLWVYALSRLGRDLRDVVNLIYGLVDRGIRVRSLSEGLDTDNKITGPVIIALFTALAEMERTQMLDRQAAARAAAAASGKPFGRPHVVADAAARAIIVDSYLAGRPAKQIAAAYGISTRTVERYATTAREGLSRS